MAVYAEQAFIPERADAARVTAPARTLLVVALVLVVPLASALVEDIASRRVGFGGPTFARVGHEITLSGYVQDTIQGQRLDRAGVAIRVRDDVGTTWASGVTDLEGQFALGVTFGSRGSRSLHAFAQEPLRDDAQSAARVVAAGEFPTAPVGLAATPTGGSVVLSWSPPSDDGGLSITSYRLKRTTDGVSYASMGSVSQPGFTDPAPPAAPKLAYTVAALNGLGEGPQALAKVYRVPSLPQGLIAVNSTTSDGVDLSWSAPESDGGLSITGYQIRRALPGETAFAPLAFATGRTYADEEVPKYVDASYRVSAVNALGEGPPATVSIARWQPIDNVTLSISNVYFCDDDDACVEAPRGATLTVAPGWYHYRVNVTASARIHDDPAAGRWVAFRCIDNFAGDQGVHYWSAQADVLGQMVTATQTFHLFVDGEFPASWTHFFAIDASANAASDEDSTGIVIQLA